MSQVDISYGVLHYNPLGDKTANRFFEEAVDSLAQNRSSSFNSEVYLIAQGSERLAVETLSSYYGFSSILLEKNVGISRGINLLAHLSRGKYVSLVTSDVVFAKDTDVILIGELEGNPDVAQICPTSSKSSLAHQQGDGPFNTDILRHLVQELTIQFWPRRVFDRVGYFDERWKACYENIDYALRCFIDGQSVAISRRAFCHHEHNVCSKNGSINHAYNGYLFMPHGLDHDKLLSLWNAKWPYFDRNWLYSGDLNEGMRRTLYSLFKHNIYLPYVQKVGY